MASMDLKEHWHGSVRWDEGLDSQEASTTTKDENYKVLTAGPASNLTDQGDNN